MSAAGMGTTQPETLDDLIQRLTELRERLGGSTRVVAVRRTAFLAIEVGVAACGRGAPWKPVARGGDPVVTLSPVG